MNRDLDYLVGLISAAPAPLPAHDELTDWLYGRGFVVRHPNTRATADDESPSLLRDLSAANRGRSGWNPGWSVEFVADDGSVIARKDAVRSKFEPGGFVTYGVPGVRPTWGDSLTALAPVELHDPDDTFYFAFGETPDPFQTHAEQVRIYWNIAAHGAAALVAAITREFNRFQLPFQFKCVYRPEEFYRLDAAVLYMSRHYWRLSAKLLRRIYDEVSPSMGTEVPMLTKRLAPGLSLAENTPGGRSFGRNRCELIARAAREGQPLDSLRRVFSEARLDLDRPYLNPGSTDGYDFS